MQWLGPCASELGTLLFFVITGYKFQPSQDSFYSKVDILSPPDLLIISPPPLVLQLSSEDEEGKEYGLEYDEGSSSPGTGGMRSLGMTDILNDDDL
jgi:hypothetical protein